MTDVNDIASMRTSGKAWPNARRVPLAACAVALFCASATFASGSATAADAQPATHAAQSFHVSRIVVSGHDLLFADRIERTLPAYLGRRLGARDVQSLLARLRGIFVAGGYGATCATASAPMAHDGTLEINIRPARTSPTDAPADGQSV
ncbi:MAG: hypothetical protein KF778_06000 [Rhodocyclaceae bacterium]|nr:hypothetical protein [Rhodocyclaceae bacterium]